MNAQRVFDDGTKTCSKCENRLPLSMFYVHAAQSSGYTSQCRKCTYKYAPRVSRVCVTCGRVFSATKCHVNRGNGNFCSVSCGVSSRRGELNPNWKNSSAAARAYAEVKNRLRDGTLAVGDCELCGISRHEECDNGTSYIHAHHEDYNKPLDIVWLCVKCHRNVHEGNLALQK